MKYLLWSFVLPFALICVANADSMSTLKVLHVTYSFSVNEGGDNAAYSLVGPKINLSGVGSAFCLTSGFCNGAAFLPGASLVPDVSVDFQSSQGSVKIGGQTFFGPDGVSLFISSIKAASFKFPAGGSTPSIFTVTVPASFAVVEGEVEDGTFFTVNLPAGELVLTFNFFPATNGRPTSYVFSHGEYLVTTPEPDALLLMATGLASIVGLMRNRLR